MKDLIILHGALGSEEQFKVLTHQLSGAFNVHSLDFPGHGKNSSFENFNIPEFSESLNAYIKMNQLKLPFVFGYSMGGYVALHLEISQPGTFEKIVTLGTKFDWNPESSARESKYLDPEKIKEKIPAYAAYLESLHGNNWKSVLNNTARMMLEMGSNPPLHSDNLSQFTIPVVISRGDQDKMVSHEESQWASNAIENSTFIELTDVPHPIDKIDPLKLNEYLLKVFA